MDQHALPDSVYRAGGVGRGWEGWGLPRLEPLRPGVAGLLEHRQDTGRVALEHDALGRLAEICDVALCAKQFELQPEGDAPFVPDKPGGETDPSKDQHAPGPASHALPAWDSAVGEYGER